MLSTVHMFLSYCLQFGSIFKGVFFFKYLIFYEDTLPLGTKIRVLLQQNSMSLEWNLSGTQWYPRVPLQPALAAATCHSDSLFGQLSTGCTVMAQLYTSLKEDLTLIYSFCIYYLNIDFTENALVFCISFQPQFQMFLRFIFFVMELKLIFKDNDFVT